MDLNKLKAEYPSHIFYNVNIKKTADVLEYCNFENFPAFKVYKFGYVVETIDDADLQKLQ